MRHWVRRFGLLLGLGATAAFVLYAVRVLREQDLSAYVSASAITGIGIAAVGYSLIIPISALAWRRLLANSGVAKNWSELSIIMGVTQLAKYIPGNVGQHIGRAAMSIERGIPVRPYSTTVVTEAILAVIAAIIVGIAGYGLSGTSSDVLRHHGAIVVPAIIILAGMCALTIILGRSTLLRLLHGQTRRQDKNSGRITLPRGGVLCYALGIYVLNYLVFGAGITAMTMLLLPNQQMQWPLLTGSFALAWVVGFFTPGAPAGLGVREGIMLGLLQSTYTRPDALLIIIALRLATTIGDILCFLAGSLVLLALRERTHVKAGSYPTGKNDET
jgi:glycosyltransferase 2 family protein